MKAIDSTPEVYCTCLYQKLVTLANTSARSLVVVLFPETFGCNALKIYFYLEVVPCYLSDQERLCWQESCAVISTFGLQAALCTSNVCKAIVFGEIVRKGSIAYLGRRGGWAWNGFFLHISKLLALLEANEVGSIYLLVCTEKKKREKKEREKRFHLPVRQSILSNFGLRNRSTSEWAETE